METECLFCSTHGGYETVLGEDVIFSAEVEIHITAFGGSSFEHNWMLLNEIMSQSHCKKLKAQKRFVSAHGIAFQIFNSKMLLSFACPTVLLHDHQGIDFFYIQNIKQQTHECTLMREWKLSNCKIQTAWKTIG